jgi:hypothetical protein
VVLQIICPRDYKISHTSIKHSLPLAQAVDQQLLAARAVAPALESLLRSCLSPNVHARPSAEQVLRGLRSLTQVPPYSSAKVWMRMGTDAAALMAEVSENVDHTLAADLAQLRAEKDALQKELELSQQSVQAKVKEEIRLAQEFLEQRNDELRIEMRKRQQFQSSYFTARAEKEISEQERNKLSAELQAAQDSISKLLQRDKRSRSLLEETRTTLTEQHKNECSRLAAQLEQAADNAAALQQRVELLLAKNVQLEERLADLGDDCASLRQRNERQEQELARFKEDTAAESAVSHTIKDALAAANRDLETSRAETSVVKLNMARLHDLAQVRCYAHCLYFVLIAASARVLGTYLQPKRVLPCAVLGAGAAVQRVCSPVSGSHLAVTFANWFRVSGRWLRACACSSGGALGARCCVGA